jgi:hypothetical protein
MHLLALSRWLAVAVAVAGAATSSSAARALSVTVSATAAGWFSDDGTHNAANSNYLTGWGPSSEFRDFFLFDLSSVSGIVTAATLRVNSAQYLSTDPSELVEFREVTTPTADLEVNQLGRTDIFTDLGDGPLYGSVTLTSAQYYTNVDVPLNASAVTAINASLGSTFAIGGAVATLAKPPFDNESVFANSSSFLTRQLVLTVVGCSSAPLGMCRSAQKSSLLLKNTADDAKDKLVWKWLKGQATQMEFADPTATTGYALCIYAGSTATRIAAASVLGGTNWQSVSDKGYAYSDASGAESGIQKIGLKGSATGKAKTLVLGKGVNLPDPILGNVPLPVTVQLVNQDTGLCLQATYDSSAVIRNNPIEFEAKAP